MDKLKVKLFNCFNQLEDSFFDDFKERIEKRIIFQKYGLFFSTIFGLTTGTFSLYIHGPYNYTLADLGYEFANNLDKFSHEKIEFSNVALNIISTLQEQLPLGNVDLLEIYSTYFYLKNKYTDFSEEDLFKKVHELKNVINCNGEIIK